MSAQLNEDVSGRWLKRFDNFPVAWLVSSLGVSMASPVAILGGVLNIALCALLIILRFFTNATARARLKSICVNNKAAPSPEELYGDHDGEMEL